MPTVTEKTPVDAQKEIQAKARAEADAFRERVNAIIAEGSALGSMALECLAVDLGKSATSMGRPSEEAFTAFTSALAGRKLSYDARANLCRKANAASVNDKKPVAPMTAKARSSDGQAKFRINPPVAVDIAVNG